MKKTKLNENNNWTKQVLMMVLLVCLMASPKLTDRACAQVFLSDDEYNENRANVTEGELVPILPQNLEVDWIEPAPLGEGWLLLAGLGGAYLLNKKRKKE